MSYQPPQFPQRPTQPGSFPQPEQPYGSAQPPQPYGTPSTQRHPFDFDKFKVNQKLMSLGSKYYVYNEFDQPVFYVDRPVFKLKAHVGIYYDEAKTRKALTIFQDSAWTIINHSFTLLDHENRPVAYFKRQGWLSMLRRTWNIYDGTGAQVAIAQEDSWAKALLRRLPYVEIIGAFIRTNFEIVRPDGMAYGLFIRRLSIGDKYIMDLSKDPQRAFDRRLAVGLSILLDTAERR